MLSFFVNLQRLLASVVPIRLNLELLLTSFGHTQDLPSVTVADLSLVSMAIHVLSLAEMERSWMRLLWLVKTLKSSRNGKFLNFTHSLVYISEIHLYYCAFRLQCHLLCREEINTKCHWSKLGPRIQINTWIPSIKKSGRNYLLN